MRGAIPFLTTVACVLWLGCAGQPATEDHAKTPATKDAKPAAKTMEAPAATNAGNAGMANGDFVLTGTTGCGHCNFHATESCAFCVQDAGGKVYVVDNITEGHEMWNARFEGKKIQVKGALSEKEGKAHIQMASYEYIQ